jgi:hypothetical protein
VAEVKTPSEPKRYGGFRAVLMTTLALEGRDPVLVHVHMQALPRKTLQKGAFVAVIGLPRHLEEKTDGAFFTVYLHDSVFPERWSEVDHAGIVPKPVKD